MYTLLHKLIGADRPAARPPWAIGALGRVPSIGIEILACLSHNTSSPAGDRIQGIVSRAQLRHYFGQQKSPVPTTEPWQQWQHGNNHGNSGFTQTKRTPVGKHRLKRGTCDWRRFSKASLEKFTGGSRESYCCGSLSPCSRSKTRSGPGRGMWL